MMIATDCSIYVDYRMCRNT